MFSTPLCDLQWPGLVELMSVRNGCIRILGLSLLSPLVFAADVPGSQDLPAVARQVDAQIVDYRPAEEKERIYPMGAIRKISGQLRYEGQATARGQATAITYELPAEHSSERRVHRDPRSVAGQGRATVVLVQGPRLRRKQPVGQ